MLTMTNGQSTFAQRLAQACDDSTIVPEYGKGRQVSIAKRIDVTQEAVRKWFSGDAVPRPDKMKELAEYLEVDQAWLALGINPEIDRNDKRKLRGALEGAVHLVTGMIMLEGGHCAFPVEKDPNSTRIDIYAIMRGTQLAIHVSLAREVSEGHFALTVPRQHSDVRCVGVIPVSPGRFHLLNMTYDLIEKHKQRRGGDYVVPVNFADNQYSTGPHRWPRIRTIGEML